MPLMLASGIAVTVGRNSEQRKRAFIEEKKYGKRELDGLQAYGFQQEHQEHVYGLPSGPSAPSAPVYEIPAPDLSHPVPGPLPEPPAVAVGHSIR